MRANVIMILYYHNIYSLEIEVPLVMKDQLDHRVEKVAMEIVVDQDRRLINTHSNLMKSCSHGNRVVKEK